MSNESVPAASVNASDLQVFLTAYDPSDLPGGSLDPLGFERGYLHLAEKILPGLTNVADRPRYFSVICSGVFLAAVDHHNPPKLQYQRRLECILRFERFWALANVLAGQASEDFDLSDSGIRGVTYARNEAEALLKAKAKRTAADYKMLSRQVPYGVVGIYGAVADGMRFLDRKTFSLTPDLGERLADGFLKETGIPSVVRKAIANERDVSISKLAEWGERSHIAGQLLPIEVDCFSEARDRNPVRARMAEALASTPCSDDSEPELARLSRLLPKLKENPANVDLAEAVAVILAYEKCYRLVMLAFERLLWLCRNLQAASIAPADLQNDTVLDLVRSSLPVARAQLSKSIDEARSEQFLHDANRLEDTRLFLERAAIGCGSNKQLVEEVMQRHEDVQRGKLDRGRRKMPWLEVTNNRISLTMTRVGGLNREATSIENIAPHPYRLDSADALISATEVP